MFFWHFVKSLPGKILVSEKAIKKAANPVYAKIA